LVPTRIYTNEVKLLIEKYKIAGLAHITGGGMYENIPRIIPEGLCAEMHMNKFFLDPLYSHMTHYFTPDELLNTFNCGYGMIVVTPDFLDDEPDIDYLGSIISKKTKKVQFV